ncbi:hypothetical protein [Xanthomonas maliensis]|uniref:hypothetical protein n=1 Tax=Xanthomonas maliensis TaxID=1321368 RepID=UPI00039BD842|nr:hypothetical protein [Xanthomonas maliensis]KAB7767624.1 hypothetical protein CKY51_11190 [Xanthomonas maliensis]
MSQIRIAVDADNLLGRQFTALEREQLPFAIVQGCNATAYAIRDAWKRAAPRVFDRPTPLTVNAAMYRKATKDRLFAEIFLRDEAFKGAPPSKYLQAEVEGGQRRKKGFEVLLQAQGWMPAGQFAVTGRGAHTDQYGNVPGGQVTAILSQLGALRDPYQNANTDGPKRRSNERSRVEYLGRTRRNTVAVMQRTVRRGGRYFALQRPRGKLAPGIYERIGTGFGSAVRSVFVFTSRANYTPRYDIFGLAQRTWDKLMPFYFNRELDKAIRSAIVQVRT